MSCLPSGSAAAGTLASWTNSATTLDATHKPSSGDPRELAGQFAEELGSALARNAALIAFATLALVGSTVIARLASYLPLRNTSFSGADNAALMVSLIAAQIAFVAGRPRTLARPPAAQSTNDPRR